MIFQDDSDGIRQQQFEEMMYLNGDNPAGRGRARGRGAPGMMPPGRGRGATPASLLGSAPPRGGAARGMGARGAPGVAG